MKHPSSHNLYRYPYRKIYRTNRSTQHVNPPPSAEEEQQTETETKALQQIQYNKWSIADKIAIWGVFVNIILALFTGLLFNLTRESNKNAEKSAKAAVTADSIAKASLDESKSNSVKESHRKKTADSTAKISQAKKDSLDSLVFQNQVRSVYSQIASLKETEKRFEISNEPYLNFETDTTKSQLKANGVMRFFFNITPTSDRVIEGVRSSIQTVAWFRDSTEFLKYAFDNEKIIKLRKDIHYYHKGEKMPTHIDFVDPDNIVRRSFLDRKCIIFIVGRVEYVNYINNKKRYYDYIVKFYILNGQTSYQYELNKNYDADDKVVIK